MQNARRLSLTRDHVARVHRDLPETDPSYPFTPMTEADFADFSRGLLAQKGEGPFWVFAYGSLIWKPAFEFVESAPCRVIGWRRSYCLGLDTWRGTPEQPGLMLALDRGGSCVGVAYRMPDDSAEERMLRLVIREMSYHEDRVWHRWIPARVGGRTVRVLAFWCAPPSPNPNLVRLALPDQVHRIARAVGYGGSCAEYLLNTVEHLEQLGLHDSYLWHLQALVAAEIDRL